MSRKLPPSIHQKKGAKSKYKPRYCGEVSAHMKQGFSLESFASTIDVHRNTLYSWMNDFPEFKEAVLRAQEHCLLQWEKMGMAGMMGRIKNFNGQMWMFNMRVRHKWRDQVPEDTPSEKTVQDILSEALAELDKDFTPSN